MFLKSTKIVVACLVLMALVLGTGAGSAGSCGRDVEKERAVAKEADSARVKLLTSETWRVLRADPLATEDRNLVSSHLRIVLEAVGKPDVR